MKQASRQQIETELQLVLKKIQNETDKAAESEKAALQQAFLKALQTYTAFAVDGKVPDGYSLVESKDDEDEG